MATLEEKLTQTGPNGQSLFGGVGDKIMGSPGDEQERLRKQLLYEQAKSAGGFADFGEGGYRGLTGDADTARANMLKQATGELSYSKEALRQGLQQNQAAQRSMAMSASPMAGPMAARTAAMNMNRAGYGMAGQSALAGIAEQQGAAKLYGDMTLQQRQQELQAALGSRQNALAGYGANNAGQPEKGWLEKYGQAIVAGAGAVKSDRRAKKNIKSADDDTKGMLKALQAYTYDYKNERDGKGRQVGVMAQDLQKAGLGHAIIDTPDGKVVHGAKLAGANTAMLAALAKRVGKLEGE